MRMRRDPGWPFQYERKVFLRLSEMQCRARRPRRRYRIRTAIGMLESDRPARQFLVDDYRLIVKPMRTALRRELAEHDPGVKYPLWDERFDTPFMEHPGDYPEIVGLGRFTIAFWEATR